MKLFEKDNCINNDKFNIDSDSNIFFTNLFPLKFPTENHKKNESILKFYKEYFIDIRTQSDDCNRKNIYKTEWIQERFEKNFKDVNHDVKRIIIVTKVNYDDIYLKLFFGEKENKSLQEEKINYGRGKSSINKYNYKNSRIYFIPNFNNNDILTKLSELIKANEQTQKNFIRY